MESVNLCQKELPLRCLDILNTSPKNTVWKYCIWYISKYTKAKYTKYIIVKKINKIFHKRYCCETKINDKKKIVSFKVHNVHIRHKTGSLLTSMKQVCHQPLQLVHVIQSLSSSVEIWWIGFISNWSVQYKE